MTDRYSDEFPDGTVTCNDCGAVVRDRTAHDTDHDRRGMFPPVPDPPNPTRTFAVRPWRSRTGL